ncbi:hypothetical protein SDC9_07399 [bioreactor metagenome]|uniref:Uncharacterized protein n=2 Tax=root TaxID=1 RepID=A0A644T4P0_9ZZZZ
MIIMTVVVAIKDKTNNDIIIGSDTMVTGGNLKYEMDEPKFFIVEIPHGTLPNSEKTKIIVGEAGRVSILEYIRRVFKPPVWNRKTQDFNTYMLDKFFPNFKDLLKKKSYVGKNEKDNGSIDIFSHLLIIHENEFYTMWEDLGFCRETGDFFAIGSGKQVALGSLHSTKEFIYDNPKARVEKAILAAGELTTYVNTDIHISSVNELIK